MGIASGSVLRQIRSAAMTLAVAALTLGFAGPARAENDQTVVLGAGIGAYSFSTTDDVREADPTVGAAAMDSGVLVHYYLEWYALGTLGFGLRAEGAAAARDSSVFGIGYTEQVNVSSFLITINWVPIGARSYARFGLLAGFGPAQYKYTFTSGALSASTSADGTASLFGAYIDWGGDSFGARFGGYSMSTTFKPDNSNFGSGTKLDGSGTGAALDLRWAW